MSQSTSRKAAHVKATSSRMRMGTATNGTTCNGVRDPIRKQPECVISLLSDTDTDTDSDNDAAAKLPQANAQQAAAQSSSSGTQEQHQAQVHAAKPESPPPPPITPVRPMYRAIRSRPRTSAATPLRSSTGAESASTSTSTSASTSASAFASDLDLAPAPCSRSLAPHSSAMIPAPALAPPVLLTPFPIPPLAASTASSFTTAFPTASVPSPALSSPSYLRRPHQFVNTSTYYSYSFVTNTYRDQLDACQKDLIRVNLTKQDLFKKASQFLELLGVDFWIDDPSKHPNRPGHFRAVAQSDEIACAGDAQSTDAAIQTATLHLVLSMYKVTPKRIQDAVNKVAGVTKDASPDQEPGASTVPPSRTKENAVLNAPEPRERRMSLSDYRNRHPSLSNRSASTNTLTIPKSSHAASDGSSEPTPNPQAVAQPSSRSFSMNDLSERGRDPPTASRTDPDRDRDRYNVRAEHPARHRSPPRRCASPEPAGAPSGSPPMGHAARAEGSTCGTFARDSGGRVATVPRDPPSMHPPTTATLRPSDPLPTTTTTRANIPPPADAPVHAPPHPRGPSGPTWSTLPPVDPRFSAPVGPAASTSPPIDPRFAAPARPPPPATAPRADMETPANPPRDALLVSEPASRTVGNLDTLPGSANPGSVSSATPQPPHEGQSSSGWTPFSAAAQQLPQVPPHGMPGHGFSGGPFGQGTWQQQHPPFGYPGRPPLAPPHLSMGMGGPFGSAMGVPGAPHAPAYAGGFGQGANGVPRLVTGSFDGSTWASQSNPMLVPHAGLRGVSPPHDALSSHADIAHAFWTVEFILHRYATSWDLLRTRHPHLVSLYHANPKLCIAHILAGRAGEPLDERVANARTACVLRPGGFRCFLFAGARLPDGKVDGQHDTLFGDGASKEAALQAATVHALVVLGGLLQG